MAMSPDKLLDILLKEYENTSAEIVAHGNENAQILGFGFTVVGTAFFVAKSQDVRWLLVVLPLVYFVVIFYSLFNNNIILVLGGYKEYLASKINAVAEDRLLKWETLAARYISNCIPLKALLILYVFIGVLLVIVSLMTAWIRYGVDLFAFVFVIFGAMVYALIKTFLKQSTLHKDAYEFACKTNSNPATDAHFLKQPELDMKSLYKLLTDAVDNKWIVFVTLLLGVVPLGVMSFLTNSFWPSSVHPFPFIKSIPVVVGDSIFLPLFNVALYSLLRFDKNSTKKIKKYLVAAFTVGVSLAWPLLYVVHRAWSADAYTSFMDLSIGTISLAGWWHMIFATLESGLVIVFLTAWILLSRKNPSTFQSGLAGWKILLGFFLLSIPDLVLKSFIVYPGVPFLEMMKTEWIIVPMTGAPFVILGVAYLFKK